MSKNGPIKGADLDFLDFLNSTQFGHSHQYFAGSSAEETQSAEERSVQGSRQGVLALD